MRAFITCIANLAMQLGRAVVQQRSKIIACLGSCLVCCMLSSCDSLAYRPTITQGQQISAAQRARLHLGMRAAEVNQLLGTPVYNNILDSKQMLYVYTIKPRFHNMRRELLTLTFKHQRLIKIERSR